MIGFIIGLAVGAVGAGVAISYLSRQVRDQAAEAQKAHTALQRALKASRDASDALVRRGVAEPHTRAGNHGARVANRILLDGAREVEAILESGPPKPDGGETR